MTFETIYTINEVDGDGEFMHNRAFTTLPAVLAYASDCADEFVADSGSPEDYSIEVTDDGVKVICADDDGNDGEVVVSFDVFEMTLE